NLADCFVLLSDYEGLPMSLLEAASCGRPLVASAVGGIPAFLIKGGGIAIKNEVGEVTAAIEWLLEDSETRGRLGRGARAAYEAGHSAAAMWEAYKGL
ncbi:MAG: glycosyltransferase family 4 protein, partial [Paludibacter sp.]